MGLLDGLLGSLGGGAGGGDALGALTGLLGGQAGGLGGLVQAFEHGGLGEVAQSWVSSGANLPISPEQIQSVLGSGPIADFAHKMGIDPQTAAAQISQMLPGVIDHLTPGGQLPSGGLGAITDLLGKLKG